MSEINFQEKVIRCKVVYYGPSGSGKTTCLRHVFDRTKGPSSEMRRHEGTDDGEGYYDYLPLSLGEIRGFATKFDLFTVPGSEGYSAARRQILEKVDGILFVADAQPSAREANAVAMRELSQHLASWRLNFDNVSFAVQCNKMDLLGDGPPPDFSAWLPRELATRPGLEIVPSVATQGRGVFEALKAISKQILVALKKQS